MILPGDALKARLDKLSIYTAGGCGCKSLAKEMNALGLERCRLDRDKLAGRVKETAAAMGYLHQSLDHFASLVDGALDDAAASLGPAVPIKSLAVIACYFNPCHYATPLANFRRFAAGIRQAKVPLHAIELAFDDDAFETDAEFQIRGDSRRHKLWQKERLLNLVIQAVGQKYDALAWIDADVMLTRPGWATAAMQLLQHYPVIQLFRVAHDLHPNKRMTKHRPSMASVWPGAKAKNPNETHPGFAWAGRSDWLLKYGLEDQMVIGGGDCTTMRALQSDVSGAALPFDRDMSPQWKRAYRRWAAPLAAEIAGRIGFVDQSIIHLWHGSARDRHYVDRWAYVAGYDPATDTHTDETGLIAWTDHAIEHKPDMVRKVADYFSLRKEDGPKPNSSSLPQHGKIPDGRVLVPVPPPLHLTPRSNVALVTVAVGEEATANLRITRPYMERYADRIGADFVVLDWPGHPQWTMSCKYAIPSAFDHYERVAFVDADVLLRPGCVNLFEQCEPRLYGFCDELWLHKRVHGHGRVENDYYEWRAKSGLPPIKIPWYLNGGVIVAPRSHRSILTASPTPMWPGFLVDQEWQMTQLLATGLPYRIMDRRANWQWWSDKGFRDAPADAVLHFSGLTQGRTAEIARWAAAYPLNQDGWAIDARHRDWIRNELLTGKHRRVLEIGSHRGFSTQAFLSALKDGAIDELHLCEPHPTPELLALIDGTQAVLHRCSSLELLAKDCRWDLVFADGDHSPSVVEREAKLLLAGKLPAVFAHDVSADARYPGCEGARLYRELFELAGYHVVEDSRHRPGERTDRGMMLATRCSDRL